jgi:fructoselysine 3-epimerase
MRLSFNTWVYSSFPVWVPAYPLPETIKRLARIGYDGIEIGATAPHAYPDYLDANARREIKKCLEDNGIELSSMLPAPGGGPGFNVSSPLEPERQNAVDQYIKVARLCSEWGGRTLLYVAGWQIYGTSADQAWEWSREALKVIARGAAEVGVTVAVEPTPTDSNLVESCDDAICMMREVGEPNVKLMFDTIHALYRNEVPSDYVYRMGKDLHHVHLADANRDPPSAAGKVDYVGLVQALKDVGFDGYLTMEIGFNRRDVDADSVARRAYSYIKSLVD